MTYHLIWLPFAFDEMGELISSSPGRREEFASILRELTEALTTRPDVVGESRGGPKRVGFFGRLTVFYRIDSAEQAVYITRVHLPFDNLESL
jgi:hypothetical protein